MDLPAQFGKYKLVERLATGGMAEVFLARSFGLQGFQKQLVIKRILPALANEPRFVSMFIKEAKITAGLTHPNIVQIFELGRVQSDHYIAMEFIHGRDLSRIGRQLRATDATLPYPLAVYIVANLMRGLAYAHSLTDAEGAPLKLVHRDISPHNVLVSFQGDVKLLDFGIARLVSTEQQRKTGRIGGGKYAYMSPEQASGAPLDARSDLFSSGIVLYELLSGRRLFRHADPEEKLRLVREAEIEDIRETSPDVPEALWLILKKLLQRDPNDRYQSAEAVEEDLWAFLFSMGWRADAAGLRTFMRTLFPADAEASPARVDLAGLADDLGRMDSPKQETFGTLGSLQTNTDSAHSEQTRSPPTLKPGERRTIVVLVAELAGLTELSKHPDPSLIVRRHFRILRRIHRIVSRYDGFVESFKDDQLVVFFGIRKSRETDLERAVGCAIRLQQTLDQLHGLQLAIGLHLGSITVGARTGRGWRYLARGDTMKLPRRLCMEAELGDILVSRGVMELTDEQFRYVDGPSFRMRGRKALLNSARLQGKQRRKEHGHGRWVRRGDELEKLADALRTVESGQGGVTLLLGKGGMGKSRLLDEVERLARTRGVPFFRGRALTYGQNSPLAPFRDLVSSVIGVEADASLAQIQQSLRRLSQLRLDEHDQQIIGQLFGLQVTHTASSEEVLRASAVLVQRLAEDQPIIMVMDDAHNLDPRAANLIRHVAKETTSLPVLFLVASRSPLPVPIASVHQTIHLEALTPKQLLQMSQDVLGVKAIAASLSERLIEASRGNPQYLAMVLRGLLRDERLRRDGDVAVLEDEDKALALPPGMDALITARIDKLGDNCRIFLQLAALVGVEFSLALIAESGHFEVNEAEQMATLLVQQGLINPATEERFVFASPLVWEVVRRAIVANRLRQQHGLIAEGLMRLHVGNLDEHRISLAHHCAGAQRFLQAATHAMHAGKQQQRQHLYHEAARMLKRGIRWAERAEQEGEGAAHSLLGPMWLMFGQCCAVLGEFAEAERWLMLAQETGSELGDSELEAKASLSLGRMFRSHGRHEQGVAHLEAALQATYAATIPAGEGHFAWRTRVAVEALELLGMLEQEQGETKSAALRFQLAFQIAGDDDELAARAMMGLAGRHIRAGETPKALALLEDARLRAERANARILLGRVMNSTGIMHYYNANYDGALAAFRASVEIQQALNHQSGVVVSYHNIGDAYLRKHDMGRAWAAFQRSRDLAKSLSWNHGELMNDPFVAFIEGLPKDQEPASPETRDAALRRMAKAAEDVKALGDIELEVSAQWLHGRLLSEHGMHDLAMTMLNEALGMAMDVEARPLIRDVRAALDAVKQRADAEAK